MQTLGNAVSLPGLQEVFQRENRNVFTGIQLASENLGVGDLRRKYQS